VFSLDILSHRMSVMTWSIKGDVKNIVLLPPEARVWFATSSPLTMEDAGAVWCPWIIPSQQLHLRE
jgi:hypothetical protein